MISALFLTMASSNYKITLGPCLRDLGFDAA